jgi:hypothetical protein
MQFAALLRRRRRPLRLRLRCHDVPVLSEIKAYADALADVLCGYLEHLARAVSPTTPDGSPILLADATGYEAER